MNSPVAQFQNAIRAYGMEPPAHIEPDRFYRFPGVGKRSSNTAGWCKLTSNFAVGFFGDHASGLNVMWRADIEPPNSHPQVRAYVEHAERHRNQAVADLIKLQAFSAKRAVRIWNTAEAQFTNHPYLTAKGIQKYCARLSGRSLVIPIIASDGQLSSLQFIHPNGEKRLLRGGQKNGCHIPITPVEHSPGRVMVCEGFSTGCTLAEWHQDVAVIAAIDAGNLEAVAMAARRRWPNTDLVIAADDDRNTFGNPGITKARRAAIASAASLLRPDWPEGAPERLTDFNDLANWLKAGGA